METVQPSTVLDHHKSTDTEADQTAVDGVEPSANRQNISDITDGPEPSNTFSRMRKIQSFHYDFDEIVDRDLTETEPVYEIKWTSRPSPEYTWKSIWNIPYSTMAEYNHRCNGLDPSPFYKDRRQM